MFFGDIKKNLTPRTTTIVKIAIFLVLFISLSDRSLLHNFFNSIQGDTTSFLSVERFIHIIVNFTSLISTSFALNFGMGVVVKMAIVLSVFVAVCYGVKSICKGIACNKGTLEYENAHSEVYVTNNIYLKTNKFIC